MGRASEVSAKLCSSNKMANYSVRVEINGGGSRDEYLSLYEAMAKEGFIRTIASADKTYRLPAGEYNLENSFMDKLGVLAAAKKSVGSIGKTAEILVTESAGRTWDGLDRITK